MSASYYESLSDSELASQTAELEERIAQIKARGLKLVCMPCPCTGRLASLHVSKL